MTKRRTKTVHEKKFGNTVKMVEEAMAAVCKPWDALLPDVEIIVTDEEIVDVPELEPVYGTRKNRMLEADRPAVDVLESEDTNSHKVFVTSTKYLVSAEASMREALHYQLARLMTMDSEALRRAVQQESALIARNGLGAKGVLIGFRYLLAKYFASPKRLKKEKPDLHDLVKSIEKLIRQKKIKLDPQTVM